MNDEILNQFYDSEIHDYHKTNNTDSELYKTH